MPSSYYIVNAARLPDLLQAWSKQGSLLCPQRKTDHAIQLATYSPVSDICPDYINLHMSPLDVLNGYEDVLFHWEGNERSYSASPPAAADSPLILYGVRPCDLAALDYLDVFYLAEYTDINYARRRQNLTVIGLNCNRPGQFCFCPATGTGPHAHSGFDLLLTPDDDLYWLECATEKGKTLLATLKDLLQPVSQDALRQRTAILEAECRASFDYLPDLTDIRKAALQGFAHKLWEEISPTCIGCTGCTAVCPTCTCFQCNEERLNATSGRRIRIKDSCQTEGFTRNAGWHNPRSKVAAVRYRLMDKLVYIEERFGKKGCVGCGRCIEVCPAGIDIRTIIDSLQQDCPPPEQCKPLPTCMPQRIPTQKDENLYTPHPARIVDISDEAPDIRRYVLRYTDEERAQRFRLSGQFFMVTVFGVGEIALSIPFGDQHGGMLEFCAKKVGKVTSALAELRVGDIVGLRGPYGTGFPYSSFEGRDVLIVGSGVGLAPVRTIIVRLLEERQRYGRIAVIASATRYEGLIYKEDLKKWGNLPGVSVQYALARPTDAVTAHVGYINDLLPQLAFDWPNARAVLCASPRRIKLVARDLLHLGMHASDIYTSLETHMRCGVGKCGHCKVGSHYMCLDGPVFTYEEMLQLPEEF